MGGVAEMNWIRSIDPNTPQGSRNAALEVEVGLRLIMGKLGDNLFVLLAIRGGAVQGRIRILGRIEEHQPDAGAVADFPDSLQGTDVRRQGPSAERALGRRGDAQQIDAHEVKDVE